MNENADESQYIFCIQFFLFGAYTLIYVLPTFREPAWYSGQWETFYLCSSDFLFSFLFLVVKNVSINHTRISVFITHTNCYFIVLYERCMEKCKGYLFCIDEFIVKMYMLFFKLLWKCDFLTCTCL